jgi:hypothetical protein
MKFAYLAAGLATALGTLGPIACTTETIGQSGAPNPVASGDAAVTPDDDAAAPDGGGDATKPGNGPIGTRSDKGVKSVDANISSHGSYSCDSVCKAAGGTCEPGKGNGVGQVERKYNNGSGTTGNQIGSCSQTEDWASFNTTMTSMTCYCSGMPVPPTVRVRKSEGLFTCSKVCASWSLTCAEKRGQYSYSDEEESSSTTLDCATAPAATAHHYRCACDL